MSGGGSYRASRIGGETCRGDGFAASTDVGVSVKGCSIGKRYVAHSALCGCDRCAAQWGRENPSQVWSCVGDPDVLECGCDLWIGCDCYGYDGGD